MQKFPVNSLSENHYIGQLNYTIHIYYCTTGRAIRGNIQFEAGSIGPSAVRDNTEAEN